MIKINCSDLKENFDFYTDKVLTQFKKIKVVCEKGNIIMLSENEYKKIINQIIEKQK